MYYVQILEAIRSQDVRLVRSGCTGLCLISMNGWSFCWVGPEGVLTFGDAQHFGVLSFIQDAFSLYIEDTPW